LNWIKHEKKKLWVTRVFFKTNGKSHSKWKKSKKTSKDETKKKQKLKKRDKNTKQI
jgi:hypothetical protein